MHGRSTLIAILLWCNLTAPSAPEFTNAFYPVAYPRKPFRFSRGCVVLARLGHLCYWDYFGRLGYLGYLGLLLRSRPF